MDEDKNLPVRVLRRSAIELYLRLERLKSYAKVSSDGLSEQRLIANIVDSVCGSYIDLLISTFESQDAKESDLFEDLASLRELTSKGLATILSQVGEPFFGLHELLRRLPRRSPAPEAILFLRSCLGPAYDELRPSVSLGAIFNAFEFDFVGAIQQFYDPSFFQKDQDQPILTLAMCDRDDPFAWPVLGHEVGHSYERRRRFAEELIAKKYPTMSPNSRKTLTNWTRELYADFYGCVTFGQGATLSILNMQFCGFGKTGLNNDSPTHPATQSRLAFLCEHNEYFPGNSRALADDWEQCKIAARMEEELNLRKKPNEQSRQIQSQEFYEKVYQNIIEDVMQISGVRSRPSDDHLARIRKRLSQTLPAGAQGETRESLQDEIDIYQSAIPAIPEVRVAAFENLVIKFKEMPVGADIIVHCSYDVRSKLVAACTEFPLTKQSLDDLREKLRDLEEITKTSIRTSALHQSLIQQDNL